MPQIIYIGGYGRSGSTVLDIALGNEPGVTSLGEIANLFPLLATADTPTCSCGCDVHDCRFWGTVLDALGHQELNDWQEMARVQRYVEGRKGLRALLTGQFGEQGVYAENARAYTRQMTRLFEAIMSTSNHSVFVDSSKTTRLTINRALALQELCQFDVSFIHLVRDGRAVMWSGAKGSNRQLATRRPAVSALRGYKTAASWTATNLVTLCLSRRLRNYQIVHYEDFVAFPAHTLDRLGASFQLDLGQLRHKLESRQDLAVGHLIAGNRVARTEVIQLRPDHDWRKKLSRTNRLIYWLLAWPAVAGLRWRELSVPK